MLNRQEQNELVESITRSIEPRPKKPKRETKPEERDEEKLVPEIPLNKVLPPSFGHETGLGVPNSSANNQPYKGGLYKESLEERLFKLLEGIGDGDQKSSISANRSTSSEKDGRPAQQQVGPVGVLGHEKKDGNPPTDAAALRQKTSPYAALGDDQPSPSEEEDEKTEDELKDALDGLGVPG